MSYRKKTLAIVLTAIMVLSVMAFAPGAASAGSDHLHVDDSYDENNPDNDNDHKFETIQAAVDYAEVGDVIHVHEGDYSENVEVPLAVTIKGAGASNVTLTANQSDEPTLQLGADDIKLSGMTVVAPDPSGDNGEEALLIKDLIDDSYIQDVHVENNVFEGHSSTEALVRVEPDKGPDLARNLEITNNQFTGASLHDPMKYGLVLEANSSLVADNTFDVKAARASVKVDGPHNTLRNTVINYPGYGWSGLWITGEGTATTVDTLSVDGHLDEHQHQDKKRGDWLKYGVYVEGSMSTLSNVDVVQTHVGISIGGGEYQGSKGTVTKVTLLDSSGDENRNHDLKITDDATKVTVRHFDAMSSVMSKETYTNFYGPVPTSGANVFVNDEEDEGGDAPEMHVLEDVESMAKSPIGIRLETEKSTITTAHIENKRGGPVDLLDERPEDGPPVYPDDMEALTTGISLVGAHHNTIKHSLVQNNDVGIGITNGTHNTIMGNNPTGEMSAGIYDNTDAGVKLKNADNTSLSDNDIRRNGVGLDVYWSDHVRAKYNNFVDNGDGIVVDSNSHVDARWNWFGSADGPSGSATDGALSGSGDSIVGPKNSIEYDPFLTAPKDQVQQDPDKTKHFAHDLVTQGSQGVQTFGTPGPATVSFQISSGGDGALVYRYDAATDSFNGASQTEQASTLQAYLVTDLDHTEHARVVIDFGNDSTSTPGSMALENGWNFVTAPQYGATENVMRATTDVLRVAQGYDMFASQPRPASAPAPRTTPFSYPMGSSSSGPNLSAYSGYWVHADGSGVLTAAVPSGVTITEEKSLIVT
ncbi:MAG: right-handed parallel beta-helix repeat-containing protein [Halobacterium sp.]